MKTYSNPADIKVAVVGYGGAYNMGKYHLSQIQEAGMQPTAVVELDPERLKVATSDFPGIETYASLDELLESSDANLIVMITPHNTHATLALKALSAGRHVICEKPLAITLEEVDSMIKMAEEKDLMLSTYHNRHWDGCILEAVDRIKEKREIGDVFRVEAHMSGYGNPGDTWRASKSISGGVHYDWGVHLLEYALQIIDSEVTEVSGFTHDGFWDTRWAEDTVEDEMTAFIRFKNGTPLTLRISSLDMEPEADQLVFTGSKGKYRFNGKDFTQITEAEGGVEKLICKNRAGEQEKYYQNVADAMTGKAELVITAQWSRRPIEILALASMSAKEGRTVSVSE